jgi:tetratricopeptide (TPR) repeat protein
MAKKVNKKFLFLLVAVLVFIIGGIGGIYLLINKANNNPGRLNSEAEVLLKHGDLARAIQDYQRVLNIYIRNHQDAQAAEMYLTIGDLYSKSTENNTQYEQALRSALGAWQNAVLQNPSLLEAQIRLMNIYNELAPGDDAYWPKAAEAAAQVLHLDPNDARAYRIQAAAGMASLAGSGVISDDGFLRVIGQLKQAIHVEPSNSDNYTLLAQVYLIQAKDDLEAGTINSPTDLENIAINTVQTFVKLHPDDPKGWLSLAQTYSQIPNMQSKVDDALEKAVALAPTNPEVLSEQVKWLIHSQAAPEQVGKVIDKVIAIQPDQMNNYLTAGEYYAGINRYADAAKYLNEALAHPTPGGGIIPFENDLAHQRINELLVDVYLNLLDTTAAGSAEYNDYLNHAEDALNWIRGREPNSPWVLVNEGRLKLVRGQYESALEQLKNAEQLLTPNNPQEVALWVVDKRLQSQIYSIDGQVGTAISELDDIDHDLPNLPFVQISKAELELDQNPSASLDLIQNVLNKNPGDQQALAIEAQALALLGRTDDLQKLLDSTTTLNLPLALLKTRLELFNQNPSAAWQAIKPWVQQFPSDPKVITPAYAALAGINDRADAVQLIARAAQLDPNNFQYIMLNSQLQKPGQGLPQLIFPSLTSDVVHIAMNGKNPDQMQLDAIQQIPDPIKKYLLLSDFYLERGQNDQAKNAVQNAVNAAPDNPEVISEQFDVALALQDYNMASSAADKAGLLNIDQVNGDLFQARLKLAQGHITAALDLLRKDQQLRPDDSDIQAYYGQALMASGDVPSAVSALQNALKQNPTENVAIKTLIEHDLALGTEDSLQQARDLINQGLTSNPLDQQLLSWSDDMADMFGPPQPQIVKRLAELKANPNDLHNILRLALVYDRASEDSKAVGVLNDAFTAHPDNVDVAQMLVVLYQKQKNLVAAQNVYSQLSISTNVQSAFMGRVLLGDLYQSQGSLAQAAQMYLQAQDALPAQKAIVESRMGDMYFDSDDYAQALKYYGPLYTADPQDRTVALRYAETLVRSNQINAGLDILNSNVLNRNSNDEEAMVIKGLALSRQLKFPEALNIFNQALALNPQDAHALFDRATVYMDLNPPQFQPAIDDLSLLESIVPNDISTKEMLAQVYSLNKQYAEAVHEYEEAISIQPDDQNIRFGFAVLLFDLAGQYKQLAPNDNSDNAATLRLIDPITLLGDLIRDSLNRGPKNTEYAQWLVFQGQYDMLLGNTSQGIQSTEQAYEAAHRSAAAALAYLRVLLAGQQYAQAVDVATQAIAISPGTSDFYVIRGKALAELDRFTESHADFMQALNINLDNPQQFFAVLTFYQQGSNDASWLPTIIEKLMVLQSQHHDQSATIYTGLAVTQYLNKDIASSFSSASMALAFNPTGITQITALRVAAMAAYGVGKYDQAKTYYLQLIQIAPTDISAYNNLAYLLAVNLNDPKTAISYALKANDILATQEGVTGFAHNSNILDTLGWVYYLEGDMSDALSALQASMQYDPPPTVYYHLGQVLMTLKKDSDARDILQNGLNAAEKDDDPVSSQIETLLKQLK